MEQLNFDVPIVRKRDKETSHLAANKQKETGQLSGDRLKVLLELIKYPLSTGGEIGFGLHDETKRTGHAMAMMARKRLGIDDDHISKADLEKIVRHIHASPKEIERLHKKRQVLERYERKSKGLAKANNINDYDVGRGGLSFDTLMNGWRGLND